MSFKHVFTSFMYSLTNFGTPPTGACNRLPRLDMFPKFLNSSALKPNIISSTSPDFFWTLNTLNCSAINARSYSLGVKPVYFSLLCCLSTTHASSTTNSFFSPSILLVFLLLNPKKPFKLLPNLSFAPFSPLLSLEQYTIAISSSSSSSNFSNSSSNVTYFAYVSHLDIRFNMLRLMRSLRCRWRLLFAVAVCLAKYIRMETTHTSR